MIQPERRLAIVIPAYKAKYLDEALASIAAQTNCNFTLYVCDDASPQDIKAITDRYQGKIALIYHRFDNNLGGDNLVAQWNRSVELADAEWIWLFSDDDVMQEGCVQAFFETLEHTGEEHDLYRFNIEMTDDVGNVTCVKEAHPVTESAWEFAKARLQSRSLSAAVEYIFRKDVFAKHNGFVNLPAAWCADDASWVQFAGTTPIYTIESPKVFWRSSGLNISSSGGHQAKKAQALVNYIRFLFDRFPDKKEKIAALGSAWLYESLNHINGKLSLRESAALSRQINLLFGPGYHGAFRKLLAFRLKHTRFAGLAQKW